jgi:hypothetical protein
VPSQDRRLPGNGTKGGRPVKTSCSLEISTPFLVGEALGWRFFMTMLTENQKRFLEEQHIPLGWMFDAAGMSRAQYRNEMKSEEKFFAYGHAL